MHVGGTPITSSGKWVSVRIGQNWRRCLLWWSYIPSHEETGSKHANKYRLGAKDIIELNVNCYHCPALHAVVSGPAACLQPRRGRSPDLFLVVAAASNLGCQATSLLTCVHPLKAPILQREAALLRNTIHIVTKPLTRTLSPFVKLFCLSCGPRQNDATPAFSCSKCGSKFLQVSCKGTFSLSHACMPIWHQGDDAGVNLSWRDSSFFKGLKGHQTKSSLPYMYNQKTKHSINKSFCFLITTQRFMQRQGLPFFSEPSWHLSWRFSISNRSPQLQSSQRQINGSHHCILWLSSQVFSVCTFS